VHFQAFAQGIGHGGYVGGDDGADAHSGGTVNDLTHEGQVLIVENTVDSQVTFYTLLPAGVCQIAQVVQTEV